MFLDNEFYTAFVEDVEGHEWKIEVSCIVNANDPDDWEVTKIFHLQGVCEELDLQVELDIEEDLPALGIDLEDIEDQVIQEYARDIGQA